MEGSGREVALPVVEAFLCPACFYRLHVEYMTIGPLPRFVYASCWRDVCGNYGIRLQIPFKMTAARIVKHEENPRDRSVSPYSPEGGL